MKKYWAYVDGGCFKNGTIEAQAYGSYKVYDVTDMGEPTLELLAPRNPVMENMRFDLQGAGVMARQTNNLAEATAMFMLISSLFRRGLLNDENHITVFSDSKLIINQLKGFYATKDQNLLRVHRQTYNVYQKWSEKYPELKDRILEFLHLERISGIDMKKILGH